MIVENQMLSQIWDLHLKSTHENVIKNIEGKEVVKVIVVPKKLVNIVVK